MSQPKCQDIFYIINIIYRTSHHLKIGLPEYPVCVIPESIFIKECLNWTKEMAGAVMDVQILT